MTSIKKQGCFTFEVVNGFTMRITHKSKSGQSSVFKATIGQVSNSRKGDFDANIVNKKPIRLQEKWYLISSETKEKRCRRFYYCPLHQETMAEQYDEDFPIEMLSQQPYAQYVLLPFYHQLFFFNALEKRGLIYEELQMQPGMDKKLNLLVRYAEGFFSLFDQGISITEIIKRSAHELATYLQQAMSKEVYPGFFSTAADFSQPDPTTTPTAKL